jgi:hypothetical protein
MVVITLAWSSFPTLALLLGSIAILLAAALHDIAARTVPNWMAGLLALLGVASQLLHFPQYSGFLVSLIVFLAAAICWRRGWMGGGDVKLLAAASLVLPPGNVVMFVTASTAPDSATAATNITTLPGGSTSDAAASSFTSPPPIQPRRQQMAAARKTMRLARKPLYWGKCRSCDATPSSASNPAIQLGTVRVAMSCSAAASRMAMLASSRARAGSDDQASVVTTIPRCERCQKGDQRGGRSCRRAGPVGRLSSSAD